MNIIIHGDFYDCQIYRNRLYLWDTWGILYVFNWKALLMYAEQSDDNTLVVSQQLLRKFEYAYVRIKGGIFPMDSAFVDNHLFTATESGLYRRYIPDSAKRMTNFREGRSRNLLEGVRVFSLSVNHIGETLAVSAGKHGLLEWYDKDKYSVTKQKKRVDLELYKVRKTPSLYATYMPDGLFSSDDATNPVFCYYQEKHNRDTVSRSMLRAYTREQMELAQDNQKYWADGNKIYALRDQCIDSFAVTGDTQNMVVRSESIDLQDSQGLRVRKAASGSFGHVLDYKQNLTIKSKDGRFTTIIEGPITRWRILKDRKLNNDMLVAVMDDHIWISDLKYGMSYGM